MLKKLSYLIILFALLFTITPRAFAKDVELTSVELVEHDGTITSSANFEENTVNISTGLRYINEHTQYKLTFENTSTENYYSITLPTAVDGNIVYEYEAERTVIEPESTVEILVNVMYKDYMLYSDITSGGTNYLQLNRTDNIVFETYIPPTLLETTVKLNENKDLTEVFEDEEENIENIVFEIEDEDILKIEDGKIIPLKVGQTNVTIVLGDSTYILNVTVRESDLIPSHSVINPETRDRIIIIAIILVVALVVFLTIRHYKVGKYVAMLLILTAIISRFFPVFIYADDEVITYAINYNVKVYPQRYKIIYDYKYNDYNITYDGDIEDNVTLYDIRQSNENLRKAEDITFYAKDGTNYKIAVADLGSTPVRNVSEGYYYFYYGGCLSGDALVVVYDQKDKKRKKKKLRDVTPDDLLLAWDFDKGEEVFAKPLWIKRISDFNSYYLLRFDDDSEIKVVEDHKLFCVNKNKFVNAGEKDELAIGDSVYKADGKIVKLVSKELVSEAVESCNVITDYHLNIFANDILTSCIFSNIHEIENMKYVRNNEECIDVSKLDINDKYIEGARLREVSKNFKGSEEETIKYINDYFNKRDEQKR